MITRGAALRSRRTLRKFHCRRAYETSDKGVVWPVHDHAHSDRIACHVVAERTPEKRPAELLAIAAGRQNHSSRKWSVRFFSPGCGPQLYSPATKTKASAVRIISANASIAAGSP
jgi:hypothetical protein